MKKAAVVLFMMMAGVLLFQVSAQDPIQDRIELGREGGTTRAQSRAFSMQTLQAEPVVEAFISENTVSVSVQNYRGSALVEVVGSRGAKQAFIQVYDMGFDVISLAGMRAGEYTIRVTLGTEVFTGTFKKGMNGR
ncbi:MAG: hypothetical protein WC914_05010 [Proteiniphilum sp.]